MDTKDLLTNLNSVFEKIFKSIELEAYEVLDNIVDIKIDILQIGPVKKIIDSSGFIIIANSILLFLMIYYIFTVLISMYNGNKAESIYHVIFKLILITLIVNSSYFLVKEMININELFTDAVSSLCKNLCKKDINFTNLKESILNIKDFMKSDFLSLDGLIKGVLSFGTITILVNFCVRYVTIIFLIIISPIAMSMLFSDLTKSVFYTWIKMLITNLLTQIFVKIILSVPLMYKETNSVMYKIILVGTIYVIYKLNSFVKDLFLKFTSGKIPKNIFRGE